MTYIYSNTTIAIRIYLHSTFSTSLIIPNNNNMQPFAIKFPQGHLFTHREPKGSFSFSFSFLVLSVHIQSQYVRGCVVRGW